MMGWWGWGGDSANPFVDFSTVWIEPLIQRVVDVGHRVEPDVLCTLAYVGCLGSAYLFHSPFRAHTTAALDTYGRVTKVFQTWSTIIFFGFHLGPQFLREKRQQISSANAKEDTVPILFFPLFIVFTTWFTLLHKMKRRWGLGVTYGGRFSVIALNSLVLAALATVHYAYCYTLYKNASHPLWRAILYYLMPSSVAAQPLRCAAKLLCLSASFILADYHYKRWTGFDPARGILWAELYQLNKGLRAEVLHTDADDTEERRDWRELVAPPRTYMPDAPSARAAMMAAGCGAPAGAATAATRLRGVRYSPTAMAESLSSLSELPAAPRPPVPRTLYHECPPDLNWTALESSHDVDDADLRRICGAGGVSPTLTHRPFPSTTGTAAARVHTVDRADLTLTTHMSFRVPQLLVKKAQAAQHPVNRPGMVPWWSTFVLFAAWQTLAGATLRFLAFDVRTIQGFATPKVFHLHFAPSLLETMRNAAEALGRHTTTNARSPADDAGVYAPSACSLDTTERAAASTTPGAAEEADIWFDWIADVGDGFNPTYAMARLLAQPVLRLPMTAIRKARKWRRSAKGLGSSVSGPGSPSSLCATAVSSLSAPSTPMTRAGGVVGAAEGGETSAPELPCAHSTNAGDGATARVVSRTPTPTPPLQRHNAIGFAAAAVAAASTAAAPSAEDVHDRGGSEDRLAPSTARAAAAPSALTDSFASTASLQPRRTPRRRTASEDVTNAKTAASRARLHLEKGGLVTLPRASFVLVGGDLAYPGPNDDTYTTRLFEPYHDAMGSNARLQNLFHAEQQRVVVADAEDADVAHVHLLDAATVSGMATGRAALRAGRATAEEALRSVPLLFAIPGNHDWFDGLTTFRKYILERTWIGGWLMPQRSSFFVLRLPHNWFVLCGDTGNTQDIDAAQRNYFLDVIERYMDVHSCVVLAAHEPGWLLDAMERDDKPRQPELNRVVEVLGTRLRLRLAGDVHHYSRHTPRDASSEAATLVVSGGGGAFLHGARDDPIIAQGTAYMRACAFPDRNTFMNMASRLWGFRVVNWKFDLVVGFLCFALLLSVLPLPMDADVAAADGSGGGGGGADELGAGMGLARLFSLWVGYTTEIMSHVVTRGVISLVPLVIFWACFAAAGADRHAPLLWRLCYGGGWAVAVLFSCCGAMAFVHVQLLYLREHDLLHSVDGEWGSELENQFVFMIDAAVEHVLRYTGGDASVVSRELRRGRDMLCAVLPTGWLRLVLRCLDPFESLGYLSMRVSGGAVAQFAATASRLQVTLYYLYVLFFYWVLITPIVSVLIGTFLLFSVTTFDYMYDGTYSAFQMEEYKHFLRFRLDAATRELHGYVVAVKTPPKVYRLDRGYLWSLRGAGLEEHRPPHLKQHPSRWGPAISDERGRRPPAEILEHFTVHPHRVPQRTKQSFPAVS
ncbi:Metallo-dependent phosphatase-like domain-containing protein [Novymonas esmeraldas]|uniref:Metallo-dependent phosphatase-like domain-containing protein n=1 Tax=Novymonas esmeraldas TaxID=1808958 RepID=A0AAW0F7T5_9TRYP